MESKKCEQLTKKGKILGRDAVGIVVMEHGSGSESTSKGTVTF